MRIRFLCTFAALAAAMLMLPEESMADASAPGARSNAPSAPNPKPPASADEPLSKKLNKNDGVLAPPSGVDPKIHIDPPAHTGDRMPVIVPPGEPGGDQSIQPK
jgi:hypothetical protein